jgi:hypothetical protein
MYENYKRVKLPGAKKEKRNILKKYRIDRHKKDTIG